MDNIKKPDFDDDFGDDFEDDNDKYVNLVPEKPKLMVEEVEKRH